MFQKRNTAHRGVCASSLPLTSSFLYNPPVMHDRILKAAIRQFAKRGYHGVSTKAIAQAAKVSEMTIFRQFGTKQRLFHECLHRVLERQPKPPVEGKPLEKVESWILAFAQHLIDKPDEILLIDAAGLSGIKALSRVIVNENHRLSEQLRNLLLQAQLEGTLRTDIDLDAVIYSLLANLFNVKEFCIKFPTCTDCYELLHRVIVQMLDQYRVPNS